MLLREICEGRFEIAIGSRIRINELQAPFGSPGRMLTMEAEECY
jgi:hypothetical protein